MNAHASEYELQRLKNINENKKILESLGLDKFESFTPRPIIKRPLQTKGVKRKREQAKDKGSKADEEFSFVDKDIRYRLRSSRRIRGQEPSNQDLKNYSFDDSDYDTQEYRKPLRVPKNRENVFGEIPGCPVGTSWDSRLACCIDGVHRPTVAGIHGSDEGCYSLALSGGYEDDLDYGVCFTYTGEGGRDLKGTKANPKNLRTAPQSKDQYLSRGNLALSRSVESGKPVRVIRGYKLNSLYAPEEGYRYDGLYRVVKYWQACGLSGFMVYKFALKRCEGQAPPPWEQTSEDFGSDISDSINGSIN